MRNLYILFVAVFLIGAISCTTKNEKEQSPDDNSIAIMAYYVPEQDFHADKLPLDQLTHIIFSFSKVIDGEMKFSNEASGEKLKALVDLRQFHPDLKVMIACGGWGADGFSDMVLTAESRKKFIVSVIEFNKKYDLDGIDMDWEYPGISGAGTKERPEDKENFTLFMQELRIALNTLNRDQTLTFASAGWKRYYDHVELLEVMKHVDYMNVMTYDQVGGGTPFTGHHTPLGWIKAEDIANTPADSILKLRQANYEPRSAEWIIDFCVKKGVDPSQIVIGAAFYGRAWKGVPPQNNGLYQLNQGPHTGGISYRDIKSDYTTANGYNRYWDAVAKAPYLYSPADSIFITYDDPESVGLKASFAKENNLGGIMFWQLGHDLKESDGLLDAIYTSANN